MCDEGNDHEGRVCVYISVAGMDILSLIIFWQQQFNLIWAASFEIVCFKSSLCVYASSCYCEKYVFVDFSHMIWQLNLRKNALESHVNKGSVAFHTFFVCFSFAHSAISDLFVFFCLPAEITRVRKDMYNDTVNGLVDKHPLELPEAVGPIVHLQEKLFVPVKEYPDVSFTLFVHFSLLRCYPFF